MGRAVTNIVLSYRGAKVDAQESQDRDKLIEALQRIIEVRNEQDKVFAIASMTLLEFGIEPRIENAFTARARMRNKT
jgi:hypothetical protein